MLPIDIFVHIPGYVFYKDLQSKLLGCNLNLAKAAGFNTIEEVIGKSDYDLPWNMFADEYQEGDKKVLDGLPKFNSVESLLKADGNLISIIINKKPFYDRAGQLIGVLGTFIENTVIKYPDKKNPSKDYIPLTEKQAQCLIYIAKGLTAKQIACELSLSTRTIESYINTLKYKFDCHSKSALVKKAWELDFVKTRLYAEMRSLPPTQ